MLTIHSYVTIRSIFAEVRSNGANNAKTAPYCDLDALIAFALLLADLYSKINNSTYIEPKMSFVSEYNFSIKKWIFSQLSKRPFTKNSYLVVGRLASILAPAVLFTPKFILKIFLTQQIDPIAVKGNESITDGHR